MKWAQWDKTQPRKLLGLFICMCIALCTIVAHNIAQNRPDNFPHYPPDNHQCSDDVYLMPDCCCGKFRVTCTLLCWSVRDLQGRVTETDIWECRRRWSVADESRPTRHWRVVSSRTQWWPPEEVVLFVVVTVTTHSASWQAVHTATRLISVLLIVRAAVATVVIYTAAVCYMYIGNMDCQQLRGGEACNILHCLKMQLIWNLLC